MSSRPLKAAVAAAIAGAFTLTAAPAQAADPDPFVWGKLTKTYAATGKYAHEATAVADGYVRSDECAADPKEGGMGYHYINPEYAKLTEPDPEKPTALLYEADAKGVRHLVAVEWIVVDADQNLATDDDRPSLFGVPFDGPMPGHYEGMPIHYDLHAWLYKPNPSGLFSPWNPTVTCTPKASTVPDWVPDPADFDDIDWTG
ncbi:hypothetical protein DI272_26090 [Streptomyces sp. Act143]|uniref:hypothetical protein n=1 Tax=Streptomyces sp. Act143 TaxID=2200760 RepID=UPI000D681353|nr:hypothetical protein [Streptomyces sp. Act143]PWI17246.1 hypothetical protein DI272_26090 [Streptomyces sp. Act143]